MVFVIYKIFNENFPEMFYFGSTENFDNRKYTHKSACNNPNATNHNFKIYRFIREHGGWNQWQMKPVAKLPPNTSKLEATIEEERLRVEMDAKLCDRRAHRTNEQRLADQRQSSAEYYKQHHEKLNEKYICSVCNGRFSAHKKQRHFKSKKHQSKLTEVKNEISNLPLFLNHKDDENCLNAIEFIEKTLSNLNFDTDSSSSD